MPASASSFTTTLTQQPWSLWWLQGQRLTLIELRRNLFAWRATWIYLLAFIPAFSASAFGPGVAGQVDELQDRAIGIVEIGARPVDDTAPPVFLEGDLDPMRAQMV